MTGYGRQTSASNIVVLAPRSWYSFGPIHHHQCLMRAKYWFYGKSFEPGEPLGGPAASPITRPVLGLEIETAELSGNGDRYEFRYLFRKSEKRKFAKKGADTSISKSK